ncbi:MAG: hypothetical protein H8E26_11365 [FCB group bacterium]|nr:hypothetical protein [FCB group bacterium]MBL7029219.1 hypothetical protein [Candidatus Neomarinimicrobiota bacterium]MBL7121133.1 hypothetical protein [Candidatus Neomarinimicrobiota bacterium]
MSDLMLLVLLKVAYLACGLTLCIIGKNLIKKKFETKFEGEGLIAKTSFKIATTSPGLVFLVAGLIVIGVAIFQQSEISEAYHEATSKNKEWKTQELKTTMTDDYDVLVEKIRTIRFAQEADRTQFINTELKQAKDLANAGKVNEAAVHLSIAVVFQPAALANIVSDSAYFSVIKLPQFNTITTARFELPLHTTRLPVNSLSPIAEVVVTGLQTLASRQKLKDEQALEAWTIANLIPITRDIESTKMTVNRLVELLDKSPHVLLEHLSDVNGRWILEDQNILSELEVVINWKIQNE